MNNTSRWVPAAAAAAALVWTACGGDGGLASGYSHYMPLALGNRWVYDVTYTNLLTQEQSKYTATLEVTAARGETGRFRVLSERPDALQAPSPAKASPAP